MRYLIYYDKSNKPRLSTGEKEYFNKPVPKSSYLLFEHAVMNHVYWSHAHPYTGKISFLPYNYREKLQRMKAIRLPYRNLGGKSYREGFTYLMSHTNHHPIYESIHPELPEKMSILLNNVIGIDIPDECPPIYCNYWEMEYKLFEKYVTEWLSPSINYILKNRDVFFTDTNYKPLPENLKKMFRRKKYPIAPFVLERLVSVFIARL